MYHIFISGSAVFCGPAEAPPGILGSKTRKYAFEAGIKNEDGKMGGWKVGKKKRIRGFEGSRVQVKRLDPGSSPG